MYLHNVSGDRILRRCWKVSVGLVIGGCEDRLLFRGFRRGPTSTGSICCNKKHLKNVGPIRYCEPPLHCQSPGVASRTPAIAIAQAACEVHNDDDDDNDNAWQLEGTAMAPWNGPNKSTTSLQQIVPMEYEPLANGDCSPGCHGREKQTWIYIRAATRDARALSVGRSARWKVKCRITSPIYTPLPPDFPKATFCKVLASHDKVIRNSHTFVGWVLGTAVGRDKYKVGSDVATWWTRADMFSVRSTVARECLGAFISHIASHVISSLMNWTELNRCAR